VRRDGAPDPRLDREIAPGTAFYLVHSYVLACRDPADVALTIRFDGHLVPAAVHGAQDVGLTFAGRVLGPGRPPATAMHDPRRSRFNRRRSVRG